MGRDIYKELKQNLFVVIVDVIVAYIRKLAFLSNRKHMVTANYNTVFSFYL